MGERQLEKIMGFPPRVELFIAHMSAGGTPTEAARRAGYKAPAMAGCRLMQNERVVAAVNALVGETLREISITRENVLRELGRIAFSNVKNFYDGAGELIPIHELPDHVAAAVSSIEYEELWSGRGDSRQVVGQTTKVKTEGKMKALGILSQHFQITKSDDDKEARALQDKTDAELKAELQMLGQMLIDSGIIPAPGASPAAPAPIVVNPD